MKIRSVSRRVSVLGTLLFSVTSLAAGKPVSEKVLHRFLGTDGAYPSSVIQASNGALYGIASQGGTSNNNGGTAFVVTPSGKYQTLYNFPGDAYPPPPTPGPGSPQGTLVQGRSGYFFGVTNYGISPGSLVLTGGSVFAMSPEGAVTTLHQFGDGDDGGSPVGGLVQGPDGDFYGVTTGGGSNPNCILPPPFDGSSPGTSGCGTIFKITSKGVLTTLHSFDSSGFWPFSALTLGVDGNLYGTTSFGGGDVSSRTPGSFFKITPDGEFTVLHQFSGSDAGLIYSPVVQGPDGNFYGTTLTAGTNGQGDVFRITPSGDFTVLYEFNGNTDGGGPWGSLVFDPLSGTFIGTTSGYIVPGQYQSEIGTVFSITLDGQLTTLYTFNGVDGYFPTSLIQSSSNGLFFYGTSMTGGSIFGSLGNVFMLDILPVNF